MSQKVISLINETQLSTELFAEIINLTNKVRFMKIQLLLTSIVFITACSRSQNPKNTLSGIQEKSAFAKYWYAGEAELTSYKLKQARYGELREGHSVLVFVTEGFSKSKQVKLDNPSGAGEDKVTVLKLNMTKNFNTGIYPYSMMQSVFTPVDLQKYSKSLKTTMTSQEWCGHVFSQYNLKGSSYRVTTRSYFESEGDSEETLSADLLEDEIWTRIRLNPKDLPTGTKKLLPATFYVRLMHKENKAYEARLSLTEDYLVDSLNEYTVHYPELDRTLKIRFQKSFPHQIISWEESYMSGFGEGKKKLTTSAVINKSIKSDYWNKNANKDSYLREKLGLE